MSTQETFHQRSPLVEAFVVPNSESHDSRIKNSLSVERQAKLITGFIIDHYDPWPVGLVTVDSGSNQIADEVSKGLGGIEVYRSRKLPDNSFTFEKEDKPFGYRDAGDKLLELEPQGSEPDLLLIVEDAVVSGKNVLQVARIVKQLTYNESEPERSPVVEAIATWASSAGCQRLQAAGLYCATVLEEESDRYFL
ncbi:MAG: hypothetical protein U5K77_03050 [Candidatus Saccharibacteria bacterium]|nr:hypothetical protein [Candidatus Saccharibacteria bacterium]